MTTPRILFIPLHLRRFRSLPNKYPPSPHLFPPLLPPYSQLSGSTLPQPSPFHLLRAVHTHMPVSPFHRRDVDKDAVAIALAASDMSLADHSPFLSFDDSNPYESSLNDSSHMIFDFDDMSAGDAKPPMSPWETTHDYSLPQSIPSYLASPESTSSQLEYGSPHHLHPSDHSFDSGMIHYPPPTPEFTESTLYTNWLNDSDIPPSTSAPINIPSSSVTYDFVAYSDKSSVFPDVSPFSPNTAYAALQPLPPSPAGDAIMTDILRNQSHAGMSMSPPEHIPTASPAPAWATQLWSPSTSSQLLPAASPQQSTVPFPDISEEDPFATQRPRGHHRRDLSAVSQMFTSSSAPSMSQLSHGRPQFTRAYSRRAESISEHRDHDATVRVTKRRSPPEDEQESRSSERDKSRKSYPYSVPLMRRRLRAPVGIAPLKSTLKPPKLAPSAWQLYFTDWIQQHQATSSKKLNVAQAAKEAGLEYARLTTEEKEVGTRSVHLMKHYPLLYSLHPLHSLTRNVPSKPKKPENATLQPTCVR